MIICNKCGKDNEDRYKFCLGCGAQLTSPEPASAPASEFASSSPAPDATPASPVMDFAPAADVPQATADPSPSLSVSPTPPAGLPQLDDVSIVDPSPKPEPRHTKVPTAAQPTVIPSSPGAEPAPAPSAQGGMANCPQCGTPNPKEFMFCGNCGNRLKEAGQPVAESAGPAVSAAPVTRKGLMSLIKPDGSEGGQHVVEFPDVIIGRGSGPLFDNDSYLSPSHVKMSFEDNQLVITDTGSLNGVFTKITQEEYLEDGSVFRIGQELLRMDVIRDPQMLEDGTEIMGSPNPGYTGRLSIIVGPGIDGSAFPLMGEEIVLGRERGDILFSDDGYVSGTHAKIVFNNDGFYLSDLGSSNGTFIKIKEPRTIKSGTFVLLGQQLFRIDFD